METKIAIFKEKQVRRVRGFRSVMSVILLFGLFLPLKAFSESKSYWARGMLIGAGSGAVVGGLSLGLATGLHKCDPQNTDLQICGAKWGTVFGIGGAAAGALVGLGIGTAIGAAIPRKDARQDISIIPVIGPAETASVYGLSIACNF